MQATDLGGDDRGAPDPLSALGCVLGRPGEPEPAGARMTERARPVEDDERSR